MLNHEKLELNGQSPAFEKDSGWVRLTLTDSKMALPDGTADGATLYIQPRVGDGDQGGGQGFTQSAKVVSQTRGKIVLDFPASYDVSNWKIDHQEQLKGGEPYYIEGTPKLLDAPGEWVRDGDILSLIPADGVAPTGKTIEIKRRDYAFDLTDRSYIRLEGLNVFAATITTDTESGGKGAPGPKTTYRGTQGCRARASHRAGRAALQIHQPLHRPDGVESGTVGANQRRCAVGSQPPDAELCGGYRRG
jgi:hypothetical protein